MYCWKCGTKNEEHAASCVSCSSRIFGMNFERADKTEITVETNGETRIYHSVDDVPADIREMLNGLGSRIDSSSILKSLKSETTEKPISVSYSKYQSFSPSGKQERPSFEVKSRFPYEIAVAALVAGLMLYVLFAATPLFG